MKDVAINEHVTFSFGAHAYNVFNHPNFDQPVNDISNPLVWFQHRRGGAAHQPAGLVRGAGSSPRFVEIKGVVRF